MEKKVIEFGYLLEGKIYRSDAHGSDLCLTEDAVQDEEATIKELTTKFEKFSEGLATLEQKIEASTNKGSHLMKLVHIKGQVPVHKGLGDYEAMMSKIEKHEVQLVDIIANNRKRNTEVKNMLLLELEQVLSNVDLVEAGEQMKNIRERWIKTGNAEPDIQEQLQTQFTDKCQVFFEKRNAFNEDKKMLIEARIKSGEGLITELEGLSLKEPLSANQSRVQEIQKEWKEMGSIPQKNYKVLNDRYWEASKVFFKGLRVHKKEGSAKENFKKHLEQREDMLKELHALNTVALKEKIGKKLEALKLTWKSAGRVNKEESTRLNDEFYATLRVISEKQFIFQRATSKFKDFTEKNESEQISALVRLTKELLRRDVHDLSSFQENMDNMHVNKGSFVDMLVEKLEVQKRKVQIKKDILAEWKAVKS